MLLGENFGRRHEGRLITGLDGLTNGQRGDDRLAAADVALQQALHRERLLEVGGDLGSDALLRAVSAKGSTASRLAASARRQQHRRALGRRAR
jgi:hypothetical protein